MDTNCCNKIREKRKTLTLSIKELSKISKVPEEDIKSYEKNEIKASKNTINKFAKATNTHVNDWVDEVYFKKTVTKRKTNKEIDSKDMLMSLFTAINRSDDLLDILSSALLEMNEINTDIELSDFAEKLLVSVTKIKLKLLVNRSIDANRIKDNNSGQSSIKSKSDSIKNSFIDYKSDNTLNKLINECKEIFKGSDKMDIIINALCDMGEIDENSKSEKATLLLETIIHNKIKNGLNNIKYKEEQK